MTQQLFDKHWDIIKDKFFRDVKLLGSHNTMTYFTNPNSDIYSDSNIVKKMSMLPSSVRNVICKDFAKCQNLTLKQQFDIGVRSLDLRVCKNDNGVFYINHTFLSYPFSVVLDEIQLFLFNNKREIIEIQIKWMDTTPDADYSAEICKILSEHSVSEFIKQRSAGDYQITPINELITLNKRLFVYLDGKNHGSRRDLDILPLFTYCNRYCNTNIPETKIDFIKKELDSFDPFSRYLYNLSWVLTPQTKDIIKHLSCCFGDNSLTTINEKLHPLSVSYLKELFGENYKHIHIVSMDFIAENNNFAEELIKND